MTFKTIHTLYALSKITAAEASGGNINLTHMTVGDDVVKVVECVTTDVLSLDSTFRLNQGSVTDFGSFSFSTTV